MKLLNGTVQHGYGVAGQNLRHVMKPIETRMRLTPLLARTLNVKLAESYIVCAHALIEAHDYNLNNEYIKLQRCRLRGLQTIIMRPSTHELGFAHGPAHLELMATVKLRDHLNLSDGDAVTVEVEGNEEWWRGLSGS